MCEQARLVLPAVLPAVAAARRFAEAQCLAWDLQMLCEDVVLILSELVTNSVVHADTPPAVTMTVTGQYLEVAVRDDSTRTPIVRPARLDLGADIQMLIDRDVDDPPEDPYAAAWHVGPAGSIAAGRGMLIVDALADEWGVTARSAGKHVWFRLLTPMNEPPTRSCRCPESSILSPGGLPLTL